MKSSMRQILEAVLKMPYYKNYAAASGAVHNISEHEDAVEDILINRGLVEVINHKSEGFLKVRDLWLKDPSKCYMENNTFISQPCGTQNSPDFIVKVNDRVYFLECKSSKKLHPTFNSGMPRKEYIYIFSSAKPNSTTLFRGEDIVSDEQRKAIEAYEPKIKKVINELNSELKSHDTNQRGLDLYHRPMWGQKGPAEKTDYFTHSERERCEQGVLDYVS